MKMGDKPHSPGRKSLRYPGLPSGYTADVREVLFRGDDLVPIIRDDQRSLLLSVG